MAEMGHNLGHSTATVGGNSLMALGVYVDSQSSNPGSIPGSATIQLFYVAGST